MAPAAEHLATVLVCCPDRRGLVAALAQLLYGHGVNILDADQHTDVPAGKFFQRIAVDLSEMHTDRLTLERALSEVAERFEMRHRIEYADRPKRMAILVSKYEHCLQDLLLRHRAGELACEIAMVISNHADLAPVAQFHGLPFHHCPIVDGDKLAQEQAVNALLDAAKVDLLVLARYMQILSSGMCERWQERVINIHHSFLPAFVGGRPYHQAHRRGVKVIGATAHYATPDLDEGPIIEQDVMRVSHRDSVGDLIAKGRDLERVVLARAVRAHLEDRVLVYDNKTVVFA
ncbi:MAG: formyltetrahydrofolate deformylase [Myxococcales bacterium]|nr:formyltetrahydrofolate deformylase [Myxococcales bacterium]